MKNKVVVFLLLCCFSSCEYFDKKKVNTQDIVNEELRTFNWNEVDEYPTFDRCKELATKNSRKSCFESTLTSHIMAYLKDQPIVVTKDINDTINIKFSISDTGVLTVMDIAKNDLLNEQIPNIDTLLFNSLNNLPKIYAAIKRGQQVNSEFKLPIIISVN